MWHDVAADGLGTKSVLIAASGRFEAAAHDVVAMVAHDLLREGGVLSLFTTVISVDKVGENDSPQRAALERIFRELTRIARTHRFVLYKGETAQVGELLCAETFGDVPVRFMWEGVGHGVFHLEHRVRRDELKPGQIVIALREHGFRCNGISSVRKALEHKYGGTWQSNEAAHDAVYAAAAPSLLYMRLLTDVLGWGEKAACMPIYALAHVTGGGIPGKFAEDLLFPAGLSAELDDLWKPAAIMQDCAEWRGISEEESYRAWNGGQGMLVVLDRSDVDRCLALAQEHMIEAKVCGEIVKRSTPELVIHSKYTKGEVLRYRPEK